MWGAGWILKGPQLRLQRSLAWSCTPVGSTHHSPPPFLLLPGLPASPLQASPSCSGELSGPVGTTLVCFNPTSPGEGDWGMRSDPSGPVSLPCWCWDTWKLRFGTLEGI